MVFANMPADNCNKPLLCHILTLPKPVYSVPNMLSFCNVGLKVCNFQCFIVFGEKPIFIV